VAVNYQNFFMQRIGTAIKMLILIMNSHFFNDGLWLNIFIY